MAIQEDHVDIVFQVPPQYSVADALRLFKRGTNRVLRKENSYLNIFIWAKSFWADDYFAETVGQANEEVVMKYIRNQLKNPEPS